VDEEFTRSKPASFFQNPYRNPSLPFTDHVSQQPAEPKCFVRFEFQRQIDQPVAVEGVRFDDVSTTTIQPQVIISDFGQVIAEQPMCSLSGQPGHISDLIDRVERGVLFGARKIRQEVFDPHVAPLGGAVLLLVGRRDLTVEIAYMD